MKNKLVKHGKKASYFVWKKVLIALVAFVLLSSVIALPVTIYMVNAQNSQIASNN